MFLRLRGVLKTHNHHFQLIFICVSFVIGFALANGSNLWDSFRIGLVIFIQWVAGALIWSRFSNLETSSNIETIALGAPIGFALSTFLDQIFLHTPIHIFAWMIPSIFITLQMLNGKSTTPSNTSKQPETLAIVCTMITALVGLSAFYYVYLFGCIPLAIVAIFFARSKSKTDPSFWVVLTTIISSAVVTAIAVAINRPQPTALMRTIYYDTDDQIFSEQMSWSIAKWGLHENSSAVGTPIKYHWLSLGWSGLVTRSSGAGLWIVNLQIVPVISFLILGLLILAVILNTKRVRFIALFAPLILFATDDSSTMIRFYFTNVTTNLLPHIWLASSTYLIFKFLSHRSIFIRLIIMLLSVSTILGKGPYGIVLASGLLVALFVGMISIRKNRSLIITIMLTLFSMALGYYTFIKDKSNTDNSYKPNWPQFHALFPFPLNSGVAPGSQLSFRIGIVFLLCFIVMRFTTLLTPFATSTHRSVQTWFIWGSVTAGSFSFFLYNLGGTQYFLNGSLTVLAISSAFFLVEYQEKISHKLSHINWYQQTAVFFAITAALFLTTKFLKYSVTTYALPILIVIGLSIVNFRRLHFSLGQTAKNTFLLSIVIFMSFNFLSFVQRINFSPAKPTDYFIELTASEQELEALRWIDQSLPDDSVLATNRLLCLDNVLCGENSGSHLVSAVSRRKLLLEGPRFIPRARTAVGEYQAWASLRARVSVGFINQPSALFTQQLKNYGVSIIYVQKSATTTSSWEPWASIAFENDSAAVLVLNP